MKSDPAPHPALPFLLVLAAAGGVFALTMGTRQTMGLFVSPLNTATGLGVAASAWRSPSASSGGA